MAEVPFRPVRQLSEYKGKGASASREALHFCFVISAKIVRTKKKNYYIDLSAISFGLRFASVTPISY